MKRLAALFMALALAALTLISGASALAESTATLVLNVSYDQNMQFSIYDADIYLDDLYVGTILQGEQKSYEIPNVPTNRAHTIYFYKSTDHSLHDADSNQLWFTMDGNTEIACNIHAHWYGVLLEEHAQFGAQTYGLPAQASCAFSYEIVYETNLAMAKYPIEMYLDDELVTTLSNGYTHSGTVEISGGAHTLTFYKQGGHSVSQRIDFVASGDVTFGCSLKSHMNAIDVKDIYTNASLR